MKVRAKVDVSHEPIEGREPGWPRDMQTRVECVLVIENAGRGDGVAGALDKSWLGMRKVVEEALRRR